MIRKNVVGFVFNWFFKELIVMVKNYVLKNVDKIIWKKYRYNK